MTKTLSDSYNHGLATFRWEQHFSDSRIPVRSLLLLTIQAVVASSNSFIPHILLQWYNPTFLSHCPFISRQLTAAVAWCYLAGGSLLLLQPWRKALEPENLSSSSSHLDWRCHRHSQVCACWLVCPLSTWVVLSLTSAWGRWVKPWRPKLFEALRGFREAATVVLRQYQCPVAAVSKLFLSLFPSSGSLITAVQAILVTLLCSSGLR